MVHQQGEEAVLGVAAPARGGSQPSSRSAKQHGTRAGRGSASAIKHEANAGGGERAAGQQHGSTRWGLGKKCQLESARRKEQWQG